MCANVYDYGLEGSPTLQDATVSYEWDYAQPIMVALCSMSFEFMNMALYPKNKSENCNILDFRTGGVKYD